MQSFHSEIAEHDSERKHMHLQNEQCIRMLTDEHSAYNKL